MKRDQNEKRLNILHSLWDGWKRVAKRIGDIHARILLTLFYFICHAGSLGERPLGDQTSNSARLASQGESRRCSDGVGSQAVLRSNADGYTWDLMLLPRCRGSAPA